MIGHIKTLSFFLAFRFVLGAIYTIKSIGNSGLALTITDHNVGFTKLEKNLEEQKINVDFETKRISRNGKTLCASSITNELRLCITENPIIGDFLFMEENGFYKIQTNGSLLLAVGDYNSNTQMYDAILVKGNTGNKKYWFTVKESSNK